MEIKKKKSYWGEAERIKPRVLASSIFKVEGDELLPSRFVPRTSAYVYAPPLENYSKYPRDMNACLLLAYYAAFDRRVPRVNHRTTAGRTHVAKESSTSMSVMNTCFQSVTRHIVRMSSGSAKW
jgi:hypothetical protein